MLTQTLNFMAATLHAAQALIVLGLVSWLNTQPSRENGIFEVERTISIWHSHPNAAAQQKSMTGNYWIERSNIASGYLDVRYIIVAFFSLSAIFQTVGGFMYDNHGWMSRLRFIEYSFSASIMVMGIAVEAGIQDLYMLQAMFILTWVTQILGLIAEYFSLLSEKMHLLPYDPLFSGCFGEWSWMVPHVAGWATCLSAYGPILDVFLQSSSRSEISAPGFVKVIVFLQFCLFTCFGFVQYYSLYHRTLIIQGYYVPDWVTTMHQMNDGGLIDNSKEDRLASLADLVDRAYIILSFVAKTLLAWLILSPILTSSIH